MWVFWLPSRVRGGRSWRLWRGTSAEPLTLVVYEAPHRILETLADLEAVWGESVRVVVARELTKLHEEFLRGTAGEVRRTLAARERIRGEIVLLIEAVPPVQPAKVGHQRRAAGVGIDGSRGWMRRMHSSVWRVSEASPKATSTGNYSASARKNSCLLAIGELSKEIRFCENFVIPTQGITGLRLGLPPT